MAMGKRQLVLAALVVALGAAVYLNWVFSGSGTQLPATQAVTSGVSRQYGQTLLVNGSAVSGASSAASQAAVKTASASAKAASSAAASSDGKSSSAAAAASAADFFSQAKLSREKAQDEAKETIASVISDSNAADATKKEAAAQVAALAKDILQESDIETLIRAKGFQDCVVTLNNDQCVVVVKTKQDSENDAAVIQDIVSGQTGLSYDKIRIIERS